MIVDQTKQPDKSIEQVVIELAHCHGLDAAVGPCRRDIRLDAHRGDDSRIELELGGILDEPIDADLMTFDELLRHGPHVPGAYVLDHLPAEEQERLGLKLVEGLSPGNDNFCGVRFRGDVGELNEALARHGINVVVRPEGT